MLLSLHMKNLALIEEEEISFSDGLNILTGETGAGKSILLGSVELALGGKADRGMIRTGAEYALVELTFQADNDRQLRALEEMEVEPDEENLIYIRRRIYPSRSQCSVNGQAVPLRQLRALGELLIDIYGQRENQRLLRREAQLQVIDEYAGEESASLREQVREHYRKYSEGMRGLEETGMDPSARLREMDLLRYEISEIESASLREGEEEELEAAFRRLSSFRKISEAAGTADRLIQGGTSSASEQIGRANRVLTQVQGLDAQLDEAAAQLADADALLQDAGRALSDYIDGLSFDPQELARIEERLDQIRHLEDKYGGSAAKVQAAMEQRIRRLDELENMDGRRAALEKETEREKEQLEESCRALSAVRSRAAEEFRRAMIEQLLELNFRQVDFQVQIHAREEQPTGNGWDEVSFAISMNPGEPARPLETVASGGELSRIMLALKTVFAGKDEVYTFIFDEIDTGISGQTAWRVAQKMGRLAGNHQILCITHLPQIASMAGTHFLIEKSVADGRTQTHIRELSGEESTAELARMTGGDSITQAALENAREMKAMAHGMGSGL